LNLRNNKKNSCHIPKMGKNTSRVIFSTNINLRINFHDNKIRK